MFCDSARDALAVVRSNTEKTRLDGQSELVCADARTLLRRMKGTRCFDVVFLDPPYASGAIPSCLELLLSGGLLTSDARVVCETADAADVFGGREELKNAFTVLREARYGAAYITILMPRGDAR